MLTQRLRCVSRTPLGSPVEPDEYWMKARPSGSAGCGRPGAPVDLERAGDERAPAQPRDVDRRPLLDGEGVEALERGRVDADPGGLELREHGPELAQVLGRAAGRERHRHDAAEHAGPEQLDEALVVGDVEHHPVAGAETAPLQGAEHADGALAQAAKAQHPLLVLAFDEGDLTILARRCRQELVERVLSRHLRRSERRFPAVRIARRTIACPLACDIVSCDFSAPRDVRLRPPRGRVGAVPGPRDARGSRELPAARRARDRELAGQRARRHRSLLASRLLPTQLRRFGFAATALRDAARCRATCAADARAAARGSACRTATAGSPARSRPPARSGVDVEALGAAACRRLRDSTSMPPSAAGPAAARAASARSRTREGSGLAQSRRQRRLPSLRLVDTRRSAPRLGDAFGCGGSGGPSRAWRFARAATSADALDRRPRRRVPWRSARLHRRSAL